MFIECDLSEVNSQERFDLWGYIQGNGREVFHGQLENKTAELAKVRGEFAVVFRPEGDASIYAFRDPVGVAPLYYAKFQGKIFFSTTLTKLARRLSGRLTINRSFAQFLWWNHYADMVSTMFNEIRRLPPGHLMIVKGDELRTVNCMQHQIPNLSEIELDAPKYLREQVLKAVADRIPSQGDFGVLLSGGFDSSTLVSILSREAQLKSRLHSFSFRLSDPSANGDGDLNTILSASEWQHHDRLCELDDGSLMSLQSDPLHFYTPNLQLLKTVLEDADHAGVRVLFTGLGGDDLFSFSPLIMSTLVRGGRVKDWFKAATGHRSWGFSALIRHSLSPFLPGAVRTRIHRWRTLKSGGLSLATNERELLGSQVLNHLGSTSQISLDPHIRNTWEKFFRAGTIAFGLEQEQELAQAYGCRLSYPLIDYDLILGFLGLPLACHLKRFDDKKLLREAMRGITPEKIRQKRNTQDYSLVSKTVAAAQQPRFLAQIQDLKARGLIQMPDRINLSIDDLLKMNYIYRTFTYVGDQLNERQKKEQELETQSLS